jgi:cytochrome c
MRALAAVVALAAAGATAQEFEGLASGPGQEDVFYACSGCHSTQIVQQQGLTRDRWDELLVWMAEDQGMPPLEPEARVRVLDYLADNYGPDRPHWPR